ncbi:hypothetical protein AB0J74_35450 [Asanoa sp. NPDC049573]|uniref:hypothetical protein n=1 Tax=Asanoa sp. NPDC049573 TaxID=3155396 RepID=UPI003415C437
MSETTDGADGAKAGPDPVFRIILHTSSAIDARVAHWTEVPECPNANEVGDSADEAIERTKTIVRRRWRQVTGQPDEQLEFVLLQGN